MDNVVLPQDEQSDEASTETESDSSGDDDSLAEEPKPSCGFEVVALASSSGVVTISKWHPVHVENCQSANRAPRLSRAELLKLVQADLKGVAGLKSAQFRGHIKQKYKYDVLDRTAQRVCKALKQAKEAEVLKGFQKIRSLLVEFAQHNPGTVYHYMNDTEDRFYEFSLFPPLPYVLDHCIPVITVDGSYIRTEYTGVILNVCVMDGNHNLIPIGIGIVDGENIASWTRFLQRLAQAHPRLTLPEAAELFTMVHDRQKGLVNAHESTLPFVNQAHCVQHLKDNMEHNGHPAFAARVYRLAKACTLDAYQDVFQECERADDVEETGMAYLAACDVKKFARVWFPVPRFGVITSNNSESLNSSMVEDRMKMHYTILDMWIQNLALNIASRRTQYQEELGKNRKVSSWLEEQLKKGKETARGFQVALQGEDSGYVTDDKARRSVCLKSGQASCTCGFYGEYRFPCWHMQALHMKLKERGINIDLGQFIHRCYWLDTLVELYDFKLNLIDSTTLVADPSVKPPPKLPVKPGVLATKRKAKGDRRRKPKRAAQVSAPAPQQDSAQDQTSTEPAVPDHSDPRQEQSAHAASVNDSVTATGTESAEPPQAAPKAKRQRQVTSCVYCGWRHYFGVTMCPQPVKPVDPQQLQAVEATKVIPTPITCSDCRWVHNKDETPCRSPPRK